MFQGDKGPGELQLPDSTVSPATHLQNGGLFGKSSVAGQKRTSRTLTRTQAVAHGRLTLGLRTGGGRG